MSKLVVTNGFLLVEKYDRARKEKGGNPFQLDTNDSLGIVRHRDETLPLKDLSTGSKVYFSLKGAERITINGTEMYCMEPTNIIAILKEDSDVDEKQQ